MRGVSALVIMDEVLGICHNGLALHPRNNRLHHRPSKVWIFTRKVLKVPSILWHARHAHAWAQLYVCTFIEELLTAEENEIVHNGKEIPSSDREGCSENGY
jgi:hypothetical protein